MAAPELPPLPAAMSRALLSRGVALLNHGLSEGARVRLAPHAGKRVALRAAGLELELQLGADGAFAPAATREGEAPALRVDADLAELFAARLRGQPIGGVHIAGDAEFAQAMSWSVEHLSFDVEDELAPWLGDIAAHRLGRALHAVRARGERLQRRALDGARDWLAEAPRLLVVRAEFDAAAADVARVRDAVARLDKRVAALQRRLRAQAGG
jgi:ubiquinone biosynthesis protein UbiJ